MGQETKFPSRRSPDLPPTPIQVETATTADQACLKLTLDEFLERLGFDAQTLIAMKLDLPLLRRRWAVETSSWLSANWVNLKSMHITAAERIARSVAGSRKKNELPVSHQDGLEQAHAQKKVNTLPLPESMMNKVIGARAFVQGALDFAHYGVKVSLFIALVFQTIISIKDGDVTSFVEFFENFFSANENAMLGLLSALNSSNSSNKAILTVLLGPVLAGTANALIQTRQGALPKTSDELQEHIKYLEGYAKSRWTDIFRWLLPFHPIQRKLSDLKTLLTLDGEHFSVAEREAMVFVIKDALKRGGLTEHAVMDLCMELVNSISFTDLDMVSDPELVAQILKMKQDLLKILEDKAIDLKDAWHNGGLKEIFLTLHAHYAKWALGDASNFRMRASMFTFQTGKVAVSLLLLKTVLKAIGEFAACPYRPGFNIATGYGPMQFTIDCWNALVNVFNTFPGQPISDLISQIPNFPPQRDDNYILDLSGNGMNGTQVKELVTALVDHDWEITGLNLTANSFTTPFDIAELGEAFKKTPGLTMLDMSYNNMENVPVPNLTVNFAPLLPLLPSLEELYYVGNGQGTWSKDGTVALAQYLGQKLQVIDLGLNNVGANGGIEELAEGIGNSQLKVFRIANNPLVVFNNNATVLMQKLPASIVEADFYSCGLGLRNDDVLRALTERFPALVNLVNLNIGANGWGYNDPDSQQAMESFAQAAGNSPTLQSLDIEYLLNDARLALPALAAMPAHIKTDIPQINSVAAAIAYAQQIRQSGSKVVDLSYQLIGVAPEVLEALLQNLPTDITALKLGGNLLDSSAYSTNPVLCSTILATYLPHFTLLEELDLSVNVIVDMQQLAQAIQNSKLKIINLAQNGVGLSVPGCVAFGNALQSLEYLTELNLTDNLINDVCIRPLGAGLANTQISILNLSNNFFANVQPIAQGLTGKPVTYLNLANNYLQSLPSIEALVSCLTSIRSTLTYLDVSNNEIGQGPAGAEVAQVFVDVLPSLKLDFIGLAGLTNASYTAGAAAVTENINARLSSACTTQICRNTNPFQSSNTQSLVQRVVSAVKSLWKTENQQQVKPVADTAPRSADSSPSSHPFNHPLSAASRDALLQHCAGLTSAELVSQCQSTVFARTAHGTTGAMLATQPVASPSQALSLR